MPKCQERFTFIISLHNRDCENSRFIVYICHFYKTTRLDIDFFILKSAKEDVKSGSAYFTAHEIAYALKMASLNARIYDDFCMAR